MSNTNLVRIINITLLLTFSGLFLSIFFHEALLRSIAGVSGALFILSGTYALLKNGTFIKSEAFPYAGIGLVIFMIGTSFTVLNWPYAEIIIAIGLIGFTSVYFFEFFKRSNIKNVEYGKPIFLLLFLSGLYANLMRWPYASVMTISAIICLILPVFYFVKQQKS
ncbi:hypothetical protein RCC89_11580 [Cytophagaceae bacterium ABcell3]|nr:hypothetical protein RCC89_11580 [Cytophagaceae bacterium ABcell3]